MKLIYVTLLVLFLGGCITIQDPRPPLMNNSSFVDYEPIEVSE